MTTTNGERDSHHDHDGNRQDRTKGRMVSTGERGRGSSWWRRAGLIGVVATLVAGTAWTALPVHRPAGRTEALAVGSGGTGGHAAAPGTADWAASTARATGRKTEATLLRGERRQVFANADGTFTQLDYQQPIQVVRDGAWVPVDATLVRGADGTVTPRATLTNLRLSGGGDRLVASVERAGRRYALTWPEALPVPVLSGSTATYANVLPDVDLVVTASVSGFTHVLVVKTPAAARSPQVRRLTFGLQLQLLRLRTTPTGGLQMVDAGSGGTVFDAPAPRMWDSSVPATEGDLSAGAPDGARTAPVAVSLGSGTLTLTPDSGMLDDGRSKFPLFIDPFTSGASNESWAMVDSGYPSDEYWKFNGDDNERAGYCPVGVSGQVCNDSRIKRLFYVMPTSFAGMTILSAKFRVTLEHTYDSTARNVSLYRAGSAGALITSATNWGNMPGGASMTKFVKQDTIAPTGTTACQTGSTRNTEFDAQEALDNAVDHGWSKTTFMIRADNESSYLHLKRFCNNAVLAVTYNREPNQPSLSGLSLNPGGACVTGGARPYVSSLPSLKAVLSDPDTADAEPLTAEFQVTWTPSGGTLQTKTWTSSQLANGSTFTYNLADAATGIPNLPENVVVAWKVRANDTKVSGPWSSDGAGSLCEFVLDTTKPAGPDIDSPQYLPADAADNGTVGAPACADDQTWFPGVGRYGTFTFDSAATDVNEYRYGFDTNPSAANKLNPAVDGGPVSVSWLPLAEGPHTVNVVAVDHAGKQSDIASCTFRVAAGSGPVADWRLDDVAGSSAALDATGSQPATAGTTTQFGVAGPGGAADKAVRLDGNASSGLRTAGPVVNTGTSFTVSVWVRLTDLTRAQTFLSQDGSGESGFQLGYTPNGQKWLAQAAVNDVQTLGTWSVVGPVAQSGKWTHLTLSFDAVALQTTLYVNGDPAGTGQWRSPWNAHGALQIGRRFVQTGVYGDAATADLADVQVWDRVLVPVEVHVLPASVTKRLGYWDLDAATAIADQAPLVGKSAGYGTPVPGGATEIDPALELGLYTGASVMTRDPDNPFGPSPLVGDGHLVLDGLTGYAATTGPIAVTNGSFSVSARVLMATDCTTAPMSVLSQPGTHASAFSVGCAPDGTGSSVWRVVMTGTDANAAATTVLTGNAAVSHPDPNASVGQLLTLTYDAAYQTLRLYVDGNLAGTATSVPVPWNATGGGLQVGRSFTDTAWGSYLAAVVDEVRVYSGALDATTANQLNRLVADPEL
ncbi:LamG-like jellyroll fold domain-containing protein [Hamadaea tsunoensis]|uniref:LamG-like jellyroll fold domain-containing protein n=1 Tax=Hamadaea tsunoensis TaxID=53368 RepID=UPI00041444C7|nr:LamG-like jellyroll fold domain-containing protein [Hamadaea tsunoensis]